MSFDGVENDERSQPFRARTRACYGERNRRPVSHFRARQCALRVVSLCDTRELPYRVAHLNNHAWARPDGMRSKNPRCSVAHRALGSPNVSARALPGEFLEGNATIGASVNGPQQFAIPRGSTHKKSRRHDCRRLRYLRPIGRPLTRYELVSASALASGWALPCPLPALSSPSPPPTLSSSTSKISVSFGPI